MNNDDKEDFGFFNDQEEKKTTIDLPKKPQQSSSPV